MDEASSQKEEVQQANKRSSKVMEQVEIQRSKRKKVEKEKEEEEEISRQSKKDVVGAQLAFRPRTVRIAAKEPVQIHKSQQQEQQQQQQQQQQSKTHEEQNNNLDKKSNSNFLKQNHVSSKPENRKANDVDMIDAHDTDNKQQINQSGNQVVDTEKSQQPLQEGKQIDQDQQQKQKKQHVYQYGNHPNYYNIRRNTETFIDPRVLQFKGEWFKRKSVLDIGCHQGRIGLQIARLFSISKYVGVDIDPVLIAKAVGSLNHFRRVIRDNLKDAILEKKKDEQRLAIIENELKQNQEGQQQGQNLGQGQDQGLLENKQENEKKQIQEGQDITDLQNEQKMKVEDGSQMEVENSEQNLGSAQISTSPYQQLQDQNSGGRQSNQDLKDPVNSDDIQVLKNASHGLDNFKFVNQDFMSYEVAENERFDVVLCLSVMKWIHFHHGDEGVKSLLQYLGQIVKLHGILLLEYQELSTYRTDIKKCRGYLKYDKMDGFIFTPDQFVPFLLNEVGFEEVEVIQVQTENKSNYQRNIHVLKKQ